MTKEENQYSKLSEKTADILDDNVLVNLFVSTQRNNLDLCIKKGIKLVFDLFLILKYLLRIPIEISGNMVVIYFIFFEKVDLIKENKEKIEDILRLLGWFPNFWVRKVIQF